MIQLIPFILILSLGFVSCTRTANKTGPLLEYPPITTDVLIGDEVRGQGTRAELFGFIRWGDRGRATFNSHPQELEKGDRIVKHSMQSAVYNALDGQPDQFLLDPHFHTVEHNFLIFKTATTEVVGRRAKNHNYRQVKRFNTDKTETLLLEDAPQTVSIKRGNLSPTTLTTSGNIKPFVSQSVRLYEGTPSNYRDDPNYYPVGARHDFRTFENPRYQDDSPTYQAKESPFQSLAERVRAINRNISVFSE